MAGVLRSRPSSQDGLCSLLLRRGSLSLGGLLSAAPNHNNAHKGADNGRAEDGQNNGDANRPDARREEVVQRVVIIDEWLGRESVLNLSDPRKVRTINRVHAV